MTEYCLNFFRFFTKYFLAFFYLCLFLWSTTNVVDDDNDDDTILTLSIIWHKWVLFFNEFQKVDKMWNKKILKLVSWINCYFNFV